MSRRGARGRAGMWQVRLVERSFVGARQARNVSPLRHRSLQPSEAASGVGSCRRQADRGFRPGSRSGSASGQVVSSGYSGREVGMTGSGLGVGVGWEGRAKALSDRSDAR
nr:hypothetical protein CFP56_54437 [Quercus suber]